MQENLNSTLKSLESKVSLGIPDGGTVQTWVPRTTLPSSEMDGNQI